MVAHDAAEQRIRGLPTDEISLTTALQPEGDMETLSLPNAQQNVTSVLPSLKSPYLNRWRAAACMVAYFTQGLNDGAVGALLPYIERRYRVSYAIVSLLFMAKAIGSLTAGPITHKLNQRFGRSKTLSACAFANVIAWIMIITEPPYPLVVMAFFLSGYCFSTISALDNVFIVNLQGGTVLLGFMQGFYGVGGTIAPLLATVMVTNGVKWSFFYFIVLALSAFGAIAFFLAFRGYENENTTILLLTDLEGRNSQQATAETKKGILRRSLVNKTTLLGGLFVAAYQGAEVSISGWVISFLISYRKGDPAHVGYVTSGFWGGITLGRFLLVAPAHKIGDRLSIIVLTLATIGFQILLWFLPNVIGNAVAVAIIGLLQGPIFPCAAGVFTRLLPKRLQVTSLGLISGMGSSGGAMGPFCTGLLAQKFGTIVFNPVCILLYTVMTATSLGLPSMTKRME